MKPCAKPWEQLSLIHIFNALPPVLKGQETTRNGALALVHYAKAMRTLGHQDVAGPAAAEAIRLLEGLRGAGDTSEATTIAPVSYTHLDVYKRQIQNLLH